MIVNSTTMLQRKKIILPLVNKLMWNKKPFVNTITNCCFSLVPTDPVTTTLSSKVNIEAQCRPLESASQLNPPC